MEWDNTESVRIKKESQKKIGSANVDEVLEDYIRSEVYSRNFQLCTVNTRLEDLKLKKPTR